MKKLILLFVLLGCLVPISTNKAKAASELEVWCKEGGQLWDVSKFRYCNVVTTAWVDAPLTIKADERLTIEATLYNNSTLVNNGLIYITYNSGRLVNGRNEKGGTDMSSILINNKSIFNDSSLDNYDVVYNNGVLNNPRRILNIGRVYNNRIIDIRRDGYLVNQGEIYQGLCVLAMINLINDGTIIVEGGVIIDLDDCGYLPMVATN